LKANKLKMLCKLFEIFLKMNTDVEIGSVLFDMCKFYNIDVKKLTMTDMEKYLTSQITTYVEKDLIDKIYSN